MDKKIVLAGGGHAHLETIVNIKSFIKKGDSVYLISPDKYHYYSGMAPGMVEGIYNEDEIRFNIKSMVEKKGGVFIEDSIDYINPEKRIIHLKSENTLLYDILSFNTGSMIPEIELSKSSNIFHVKPIKNLILLRDKILGMKKGRIRISVVGGGPAGVEIACSIFELCKNNFEDKFYINLFSGSGILSGFNKKFKKLSKEALLSKNINIINSFAKKIENNIIYTKEKTFESDIIVIASGVKPSDIFKKSSLAIGPDGELLVNKYLQSIDHENIFGGGDCIYIKDNPVSKVGVYAVRQNPVLLNNIKACARDRELIEFDPGPDYLQILNIGDKTGILKKKNLIYKGKSAFFIKNYIDKKFMKRFKAYE